MSYMNGSTNGHSHHEGENGFVDHTCSTQWVVGLINGSFKYLTAESFGFKINSNGISLKKKQLWTLEAYGPEGGVCLRSHLDRYLSVDQFGNATCDQEEKDASCKFVIVVADDGSGRWAFRHVGRGYYIGAGEDSLICAAKLPGSAELWTVHLAARPQVNIRSVGRKRFAHLSENMDEIQVDANIPWGEDTLFTLEFRDGRYAIHTCNNAYLQCDGRLVVQCTNSCLYTMEFHGGYLALRDQNGRYLSPIGSKAVMKTRSSSVTKDELFSLEDSLPQASFVAFNNRYVSVKQGIDLTANQDEITSFETFQLEYEKQSKKWYIRTMQDKYWTLESTGGIQSNTEKGRSTSLFDLVWSRSTDSIPTVMFKANNNKFIAAKKSGHLYANADGEDESSRFFFYLINRPILVLKCEQGFVGYKSASSTRLECNKAQYETITVQRGERGACFFKGVNGKFWNVSEGGISVDSDVPQSFYLELREPSKICIKAASGGYIIAEKNGGFRLANVDFKQATLWEY